MKSTRRPLMRWKTLAFSLVALGLVFAVFVHLRAGARERAAEAAYPARGQFVEINGLRVHAVVRGLDQGKGPDVILIHGSNGNTRDMEFALLDQLKDRYRVHIFDRPGLGYSDRLPRGAEGIFEQAAHLRLAAEALGATNPIVLGHSYGAAVALAWALDAPKAVGAVVNVSGPSHAWDTDLETFYKVTSSTWGAALVVPMMTAFINPDGLSDQIESIFVPQSMPEGFESFVGVGLSLKRTALRANASHRATLLDEITAMQPRYAAFPVPLEIVHGEADTTVGVKIHAEKMLRDTDQARLTALPVIGHMPHHVSTDEVVAAIHRAAMRAAD